MDKIKIENLTVFAKHGVLPEENVLGQKFVISCELELDLRKAGSTDALDATVDYGAVSHLIQRKMNEHTCQLVEKVAETLAEAILTEYECVKNVKLEVKKPWAPIGLLLDLVSVQIERGWHDAFIALGSNIGESRTLMEEAVWKLKEDASCRVEKVATFIETEPYGVTDQPVFLNSMLRMKTLYSPEELLDRLHEIEQEAGRERKIHWGPRTLDLDIIFYDDLIMDTEDLIIPHVDMKNRDFVLVPLAEIAPGKVHPVYHKTVKDMLEELKAR